MQSNKSILGVPVPVSAEELKIRSELGMKIERDLEEEIKEGIYHLALRLHRILQQRKERDIANKLEASSSCGNNNKVDNNNRSRGLCEVNISIRMEGGTKIEIKEVNKLEAGESNCRVPKQMYVKKRGKKFEWEKSLRAGSSPVSVNRSCVSSSKHKLGKNVASADKKLLQLGWKV